MPGWEAQGPFLVRGVQPPRCRAPSRTIFARVGDTNELIVNPATQHRKRPRFSVTWPFCMSIRGRNSRRLHPIGVPSPVRPAVGDWVAIMASISRGHPSPIHF